MHRPTRTPTHAASTVLALALLGACAAPAPAHKGEVQGAEASTREWGQSDINRVATIATEHCFHDTLEYWRRWSSHSSYRGRWQEMVTRSALAMSRSSSASSSCSS